MYQDTMFPMVKKDFDLSFQFKGGNALKTLYDTQVEALRNMKFTNGGEGLEFNKSIEQYKDYFQRMIMKIT